MNLIKTFLYLTVILLFSTNLVFESEDMIIIYTIGDSTMANKPDPDVNPERGWGQMLEPFFTENIRIDNRAVNGRSTRSFRDLGHWSKVTDQLKTGDYVFIQFGHNDSKVNDPKRFTNAHVSYRHNLMMFVNETRAKGAIPVLFTSIARRKFNEHGVLVDTHGDYPLVTRMVAQELDVVCIDLQYYSELLEESYGVEGSKKLHLHIKPGENAHRPNGIKDNTHLSVLGAKEIASLAVQELKKQNLDLVKYIVL